MKKETMSISEYNILRVFDILKTDNNCSTVTISQVLGIGRATVHRAIVELKRRKWIKPKAERVNNIVEYVILKKD